MFQRLKNFLDKLAGRDPLAPVDPFPPDPAVPETPQEKAWSVVKGALLAAAGAGLAIVVNAATGGAFGPYSAVVGALASVALNALRKYAA